MRDTDDLSPAEHNLKQLPLELFDPEVPNLKRSNLQNDFSLLEWVNEQVLWRLGVSCGILRFSCIAANHSDVLDSYGYMQWILQNDSHRHRSIAEDLPRFL